MSVKDKSSKYSNKGGREVTAPQRYEHNVRDFCRGTGYSMKTCVICILCKEVDIIRRKGGGTFTTDYKDVKRFVRGLDTRWTHALSLSRLWTLQGNRLRLSKGYSFHPKHEVVFGFSIGESAFTVGRPDTSRKIVLIL